MIDINLLRKDPDALAAAMAYRGVADFDIAEFSALDAARRAGRVKAEALRSEQKDAGKHIATLDGDAKQEAIAKVGRLAEEYKQALAEADRLDAEFEEKWIPLPNPAHPSVPQGDGEHDNEMVSTFGQPPDFDFEPKDHQDLGEALGILEIQQAAKVSGSRFGYLKGKAAMLEFALVRWAMDDLTEAGFEPVIPPVLVREEVLFGTGFFPEAREQVYATKDDDLFLAGTAEIPLAGLHMDQILDEEELPRRYVGFSTCFRREAGTYGKDTKGIFRVHQFDKVEMFSFCNPAVSWDEHEFLFAQEERLIQALGIPYRVVNVCTGDLGAPAAKKYDIEAWLPSQGAYRELTSCSNTTDYQARRLRIRYRGERGNRLLHTLNGTAVAVGRTLLTIMENFQEADGSIVIPDVLRPYAGFDKIAAAGGR